MAVDDGNTVALLHCDGADTSTTFTDESGKIWTARVNAQLDTAQKKFGTASGIFDVGEADSISTPDHADFDFDSGDMCIDLQIRFASVADYQWIYTQDADDGGNNYILLYWVTDNKVYFQTKLGGVVQHDTTWAWTPVANTWYHFELNRDGDNFKMFIDGTQIGGTYNDASDWPNVAASVFVGGRLIGGSKSVYGWLDEIRITKGIYRHTANFTSPTAPYTHRPPGVKSVNEILSPKSMNEIDWGDIKALQGLA